MSGDPIPTEPPPTPPTPARRTAVTCEFCRCQLTASGEVLRMSTEAKAFREAADDLATANAEITELEAELTDVKSKLAAATAPPPTPEPGRRRGNEF
jgi:hypothetical protein